MWKINIYLYFYSIHPVFEIGEKSDFLLEPMDKYC